MTDEHERWGFGLRFLHLRNVKSFGWNHKRVYRICRELGLHLRIKPHHRLKRAKPDRLAVPERPNQMWSGDFTSDQTRDGRSFRILYVVDDATRARLCMEIDYSFPAPRVLRALDWLIEWRGKPEAIRFDNGLEFINGAMRAGRTGTAFAWRISSPASRSRMRMLSGSA